MAVAHVAVRPCTFQPRRDVLEMSDERELLKK